MAERKQPRRTRERILETSLQLFNGAGEPRPTTTDIAAELGISPGNLYYHFRNKSEIVAQLFAAYEARMAELEVRPSGRAADVEDLWLILHLQFEATWDYRFLYRDLDEILSRDDRLAARLMRLTERRTRTVLDLCESLVDDGSMIASGHELEALSDNVALVATYWFSYRKLATGGREQARSLDRAVYQVLSLIAPFLQGEAKALIDRLRRDYL